MFEKISTAKSDYLGIISSILCLIHCLALPFFFLLGIQFNEYWKHNYENFGLLFLFISFITVFYSAKNANSLYVSLFMWLFFISLAIGILFEENFRAAQYLLGIGSVGLVITHIANIRHCMLCEKCTNENQN